MSVYFEETGEERKIKKWCQICFPNYTTKSVRNVDMVSPRGMAHRGADIETGDRTHCNKDVTKDGWWCRL